MSRRFSDKVVVVSETSSDMGKATALGFASEGASITLVDSNRAAGEAVLQMTIGGGAKAIFIEADVSKEADARRIISDTVTTFGRLDILHNNATIVEYGTVRDMSVEAWDRVNAVNLRSVFLCSKYAIPEMEKQGGGVIINTSSVQGVSTQKHLAAYSASRAGVIALTKMMALDHAKDGIRVNYVCPIDVVNTHSAAQRSQTNDTTATTKSWAEASPIGGIGDTIEVTNTVLFLASDDASSITGSSLTVGDGLLTSLI